MSRLRKITLIPAASWTKWVVVSFWVLVLVILFPLSAKRRSRGGDTVVQNKLLEGIKVQAVRTARLGSAGRLRGDRDQLQSRHHTWGAGNAPARTSRDLNAR